ncbi:uncharacterized protein LOC135949083 [Calliphora vicina]|uniref:uncharacterized protein LOC135949083 n=1 Tax=Calliphora vicina TaxID=7373 RepID=UPI00325ADF63
MHRGKVAHALLPQIAKEHEADMIIISEQYTKMRNGLWLEDDSETAAIWIPCPGQAHIENSGKRNGFVWLQIGNLTLVSCYLTPSDSIASFQGKLDRIEDFVRFKGGDLIVAGDFNSRAIEWGMKTTDSRGRRILHMIARAGLATANIGTAATFRRPGCEGTIPDVTFVSERMAHKVKEWRVLEIYTASDHQYISFCLRANEDTPARKPGGTTQRWHVNKLDTAILLHEIDIHAGEHTNEMDARSAVKHTMSAIARCCNKAMPKRNKAPKWKPVYWWNASIEESRRNCIKSRRRYTRARRRGDAELEQNAYKDAKKQLHNCIHKSKKDKWEELRTDINKNPWGLGYKIVMKKLGMRNAVENMDEVTMQNIVNTLFPKHDIRMDGTETESSIDIPLFTMCMCMLDTAGKLLERLIKPRLDEAIKAAGGLSRRQYGFRPGKSTI